MSLADELAWRSGAEIALLIRQRKLSPVEVVEAFISRIEARNPSLNALVYLGFDDARKEAKAAEEALMSGAALGPLHGVPTAIKDLFDFKPGWPATFGGIRAMKDFVTDFHCVFAERVENAGAIILGKGNAPVMGLRGTTDNYLFGPTGNPFDPSRNPGGSSGGCAAAVGDGMLPFAEGTDGGGSIRIPASWCGIFGFKPSPGRVPLNMRPDAFSVVDPFIHEGPLTRTVEDAALLMSVLDGIDPRDPYCLLDEVDYLAATRQSIKGKKIAYTPDFGVFPVDPAVRETVAKAVRAFEEAGAIVEEVKFDIRHSHKELGELWCRLIMPLNVGGMEGLKAMGYDLLKDHRDDLPPEFIYWIEQGYKLSPVEIWQDQVKRTEIFDAIQSVLADYDYIVSPTLAALPVENGTDGNTLGPATVDGVEVERLIGWCMTYFMNFTGHPAATVPAGLAHGKLPVGMQIIGRRCADASVFAASAAFERLRPWADTYKLCEQRSL